MNTTIRSIPLAAAMAALIAGCGPSDEPAQEAATPGTVVEEKTMVEKAGEAAKQMTDAASETLEEAGEAAKRMTESASAKMDEAAHSASQAAEDAMDKGKEITAVAVAKTQEMADAAGDKVAEMIAQIKTYIAENKPDLAQGLLDQLAAMKDSLPESVKTEIAKLEAMLGGEQQTTPGAVEPPAATN